MSGRSLTRGDLKVFGAKRRPLEPLRRPAARTIAVASGKGGVGKSTLLVNLAIAFGESGLRVLLVDGDWGMGNVDILLGLTPQATLHDVVRGRRSVKEVLLPVSDRLLVLSAASGVEEMANLDELRSERLLCALAGLEEECDLILLDTASGVSRGTVHLALAADEIIIVTTPEPTAIVDAYASFKVLARHARRAAPWLVVNEARSAAQARAVAARLASVSRRALRCEPRYLGFVPHAEEVSSSVLRQQPFMRLYPDSSCAASIREIAARLTASPEAEPDGIEEPSARVVNLEDAPA